MIAVGDGSTPRTAATFCLHTAWQAISIDPNLRYNRNTRNIKRLDIRAKRIEDTTVECDKAIIVACHNHSLLRAALKSVKANSISVVALPCCVPQELDQQPDIEYNDFGCMSPARTIKIWRNI